MINVHVTIHQITVYGPPETLAKYNPIRSGYGHIVLNVESILDLAFEKINYLVFYNVNLHGFRLFMLPKHMILRSCKFSASFLKLFSNTQICVYTTCCDKQYNLPPQVTKHCKIDLSHDCVRSIVNYDGCAYLFFSVHNEKLVSNMKLLKKNKFNEIRNLIKVFPLDLKVAYLELIK